MWVLKAIISLIFWAGGYSIISGSTQVINQFTIETFYGFVICVTNFLAAVWFNTVDNFFLLEKGNNGWKVALYIILFTIANFSSMSGLLEAANDGAGAIFVTISSLYPVMTSFITYVFMGQRNIDLRFAIPSVVFAVLSVVFASLSKKS